MREHFRIILVCHFKSPNFQVDKIKLKCFFYFKCTYQLYAMLHRQLFFFKRGKKCGIPEKACFLGCYLIAAQVVYVVVKKQYKLSSKKIKLFVLFSFPPTKVLHFFGLSKEILIFFMQKIVYVGEKM